MGGGPSILYDYQYQKERSELRLALIKKFEQDPNSRDVLGKIRALRELLNEHSHINATAAQEIAKNENIDAFPTGLQSAYNELDRLFTVYETCNLLRSVQCRIGTVACPLGHYTPYFDDLRQITENKKIQMKCNICEKATKDGYHCSYCYYTLCVPCSVVYCVQGHVCKLWTHPESDHHCNICQTPAITSGYRCITCSANNPNEDYNICDYCTWKDGREVIIQQLLTKMASYMTYMINHMEESETARKTVTTHQQKVKDRSYATILELYTFSEQVHHLQENAIQEVKQTRLTRAIQAIRDVLVIGQEFSVTAKKEAGFQGQNFTQEELERVQKVLKEHDYLRSVAHRTSMAKDNGGSACPLGHAYQIYPNNTIPEQYKQRVIKEQQRIQKEKAALEDARLATQQQQTTTSADRTDSLQVTTEKANQIITTTLAIATMELPKMPVILCKICARIATQPSTCYHCDYCEYDVCATCRQIFCQQGHVMKQWTEANVTLESCSLCHREALERGYYCSLCSTHLCDLCTTKEQRKKIRGAWEQELTTLIAYMQQQKRLSDIALYYSWRFSNQIVSIGRLVDYVHELRTAKLRTQKQIEQKSIIDKIKKLRSQLMKEFYPLTLCQTAKEEAEKTDIYVFINKKQATEELTRMAQLLQEGYILQSEKIRSKCKIACPFGHGMEEIGSVEELEEDDDEDDEGEEEGQGGGSSRRSRSSKKKGSKMGGRRRSTKVRNPIHAGDILQEEEEDEEEDEENNSDDKEDEEDRIAFVNDDAEREEDTGGGTKKSQKKSMKLADSAVSSKGMLPSADTTPSTPSKPTMVLSSSSSKISPPIFPTNNNINSNSNNTNSPFKMIRSQFHALHDTLTPLPPSAAAVSSSPTPAQPSLSLLASSASLGNISKKLSFTGATITGTATAAGSSSSSSMKIAPFSPSMKQQQQQSSSSSLVTLPTATINFSSPSSKSVRDVINNNNKSTKKKDNSPASSFLASIKKSNKQLNQGAVVEEDAIDEEVDTSAMVSLSQSIRQEFLSLVDQAVSSPFPSGTLDDTSSLRIKPPRSCRICGTVALYPGGHSCSFCSYDLCMDCSLIYCRHGHPLRIWTMPEAITLECNMCKKHPITMGYRCLTCNIDICDMCTTRDCRNAFMLWPRREFQQIIQHLEHYQRESDVAKQYLHDLQKNPDKTYFMSMSKLCRKLVEIRIIQEQVDQEMKGFLQEKKAKTFGSNMREMF